jgi:hypothetical protein
MKTPQTWARVAGLVYAISMACNVFVPVTTRGLLVANDAAQTAANIMAAEPAFRLAFTALIAGDVANIAAIAILYMLTKPAGPTLAAIAAFMGLAGCAIGSANALHDMIALMYLGDAAYLAAFSQEQLAVLARLSVRIAKVGDTIGVIFLGVQCLVLAALVFRARFMPRWTGVLLLLAGAAWLIGSLAHFLQPTLGLANALIPAGALASLLFMLWLLIMGVNTEKWLAQAAAAEAHA